MMRDSTAMFNRSGQQVAAIGLNEAHGLWQIVVLQHEELEFFCPTREMAFAAWNDEFLKADSRERQQPGQQMPETGPPMAYSPR